MSLDELNALDQERFVAAIGWVFEHSPWVAEQVWNQRPFPTAEALSNDMNRIVESAPVSAQLALLRAHPDLGTRAKISLSSEREQAGAGLDKLTPEEHGTLLRLNTAYKERFGFPFLFAVKGAGKSDILEALSVRLMRAPDEEFAVALQQVYRIARFRLEEMIQ